MHVKLSGAPITFEPFPARISKGPCLGCEGLVWWGSERCDTLHCMALCTSPRVQEKEILLQRRNLTKDSYAASH